MANKKITDLTELTEAAGNDYLEIVDTSVNTSKKISLENLTGGLATSTHSHDHGNLTGLGDDDHPQYKRVSEMRFKPMSGLDDDTAVSLTPPNNQGFLLYRGVGAGFYSGAVISFDAVTGTAHCFKVAGSADIETRTGALSGTTGTDGKITISAHTDGKVYIENRLGTTIYGGYITL